MLYAIKAMDPLVAAEQRRSRNALSTIMGSRPPKKKVQRASTHAGDGWRDALRDLGDPSVVADNLRQDWEHSDVPAGLKQLGTAGLAGLQLGTRLGKML